MNKLRTRLILLTLGGSIFSILLVSIITNINVLRNFDRYMEKEQENRLEEILQLVEQSYSREEGWTEDTLESIRTSPLIHNFDIEIKDKNNNIIFTHYMENSMVQMHKEMMGRMGRGMMRGNHYRMMNSGPRGKIMS